MSDFGMFEADEAAARQPRVAAKTAARKLEAAIEEVRAKFGPFLLGATGIDEFEDRWHYSKADVRKSVEPYVFPNTGTMRRVQNAMKADWKLAHPYKLALEEGETRAPGPLEGPMELWRAGDGDAWRPNTEDDLDMEAVDRLHERYHNDPFRKLGPELDPAAGHAGFGELHRMYGPDGGWDGDAINRMTEQRQEYERNRTSSTRQALSHGEAGFGSMPTEDTERNQNLKQTYQPSDGNLIPKGDFAGYKDSVDQDGPEKVSDHDFTPGGDSGKHASRRQANPTKGFAQHLMEQGIDPNSLLDDQEGLNDHLADYINGHPGLSDGDAIDHYDQIAERLSTHGFDDDLPPRPGPEETYGHGDIRNASREAAMLVADIYTDFARSNGLRVASLDTLDAYAETGIHEADYRLLQSMIVATAASDEDCDDDEDDEDSEDSDDDTDSEAPTSSESDDDDSDDDSDDAPDFGGSDDHEEPDADNAGGPSDGDADNGGGQSYTVPEHAPELDPQMLNEIPHDDTNGSAPIPPEVVDSLLGLPEGTIEQLLMEEVEQGQGGSDGFGGAPQAPQGGGDDFFGQGGGDNTEPPRVARRRQAGGAGSWYDQMERADQLTPKSSWADELKRWENANPDYKPFREDEDSQRRQLQRDSARRFWAAPDESEEELTERQKQQQKDALDTQHERWTKSKAARRFWAAEDEQSGGDAGGGDQGGAPAQDPAAAAGGMDPNAMAAGGGMLPPPGSAAIQPPAPPAPIENQPAEDQLLDMASQAISQMIDRETQEYQQIIDPLSQALQAVQFAQQVEQSEHPMDVTPPQGTVNVDPSAAPGGAQNPMQQQASRRFWANGDDPYAQPYGTVDRGGPSIDDPSNGPSYQGVHPDISKALQNRFEGGGKGVWHPDKPGVIIHNLGNFWDGPREVKHLGGGELEYTNPWNGDSDRFNAEGYYNRKGEHVPWRPEERYAARRQAKRDDILRKAAYVIAQQYGLSEEGYRTLVAATLGRRDYEHVVEALRLVPQEYREGPAKHITHLLAAGNPVLNKDIFMKTVMAANPRDRAGDAWRDGRDRGVAEHGRHDMDDRGDDANHPMFWFQGEEPPVKPGPENPDHAYYHASRGRLPFDRPRLAGESWVNHSIPDTFEFENDVPQSRDNMTINDLPKAPGGHVGSSQKVVDRFQRWVQHRQQMGLPADGGEAGVHNFLQTTKPYKSKVGEEAEIKLHRNQGLEPDTKMAPKVKVPKATTPGLKGTGKTPPAPKPKAPKVKAASFFTRKVPGWRWDDHLNGYISKEGRAFTCTCGQKVAAPSYKSCDCGKIWNVYAIGDTHHLASDSAEMFIAREIPVRDNVIMANRKLAGADSSKDADAAHRELLAVIDRYADWTKYDDAVDGKDPVAQAYGKTKVPSTKAPKIPRDWSQRGPDGKWKNTNFAPKKK